MKIMKNLSLVAATNQNNLSKSQTDAIEYYKIILPLSDDLLLTQFQILDELLAKICGGVSFDVSASPSSPDEQFFFLAQNIIQVNSPSPLPSRSISMNDVLCQKEKLFVGR